MSVQAESTRRRRPGRRPGQGLVEFVMVAPLLLLLIFGLIEFARAWNIRHVITDAAREGARNLAIDNPLVDKDSVLTAVTSAMGTVGLIADSATIVIRCEPTDCPDGNGNRGESARVTITYPFELKLVRTFLGWAVEDARLQINSTFVMRNE
jgi:Flp pilus assembly protein TadG